MNNQQAFEGMIAGMRRQGWERSVVVQKNGISSCQYRGEKGLRCAVGHLISDDTYKAGMELDCLHVVYDSIPELDGVSIDLLQGMQVLHDRVLLQLEKDSSVDIVRKLDNIAKVFDLHFDPSWVLEEPRPGVKVEIKISSKVKELCYE